MPEASPGASRREQRLHRVAGKAARRPEAGDLARDGQAQRDEVELEHRGQRPAVRIAFVEGRPVINRPKALQAIPASTALSDTISKDLKRRGFRFVGTTIIYAFLQAVGVVNDHSRECFLCPPR